MKVFWLILGIIVIGGLALLVSFSKGSSSGKAIAGYSTGDPNAPKIEIAEKKFDFGQIALKDEAKHDFKIKNIGKNSLIVSNIMTSCHCTAAVFKAPGQQDSEEFGMHVDSAWQGEVPAGGEATLEVIYRPATMPASGPVSRVITFNTNDPENGQVQLEIVANVQ